MEHDLFGKPVSTFPDHALRGSRLQRAGEAPIFAAIRERQETQEGSARGGPVPQAGFAKGFIAVDHAFSPRGTALALILIVIAPASRALAQDVPIKLVPHRAVYDLALEKTRGNSQVSAVRGRILYDFSGNACEGYSLEFRQVSELESGEDKDSTSDLRSTTWEGADAKSFKFTSRNFVNENLVDTVDGHAERGPDETAVDLLKPEQKTLDLDAKVVFPTEHMMRVIEAARAGKSILEFPVYDGSDTGEKVFDTLTVIGRKIGPNERQHDDVAATDGKLASIARWPVTILFRQEQESGKQRTDTGLRHRLRALREWHFARAGARLQRFRGDRKTQLAGTQRAEAVPVSGA
jgi:hypothetical protein